MFGLGLLTGLVITLAVIQWKTGLIWDTIKPTIIDITDFLDKLKNLFRNLFNKK